MISLVVFTSACGVVAVGVFVLLVRQWVKEDGHKGLLP